LTISLLLLLLLLLGLRWEPIGGVVIIGALRRTLLVSMLRRAIVLLRVLVGGWPLLGRRLTVIRRGAILRLPVLLVLLATVLLIRVWGLLHWRLGISAVVWGSGRVAVGVRG
jgi:hypothetical protein